MRARWTTALLLLGACSGRSGCSHAGTNAAANLSAIAEACDRWSARYCARLEACAPVAVEAAYGDIGQCVARNRPGCTSALRASGTGSTPASVTSCADAYDAASCDDVVVGRAPAPCHVPGALPAGAACGDDAQCAGAQSYCQMGGDDVCGTCATLGELGATCDSDRDCASGLVCYFTCMAPVGLGDACDGMTRQCPQTLVCFDYVCSAPAAVGAACDPRGDRCDHDHGAFCDPASKTCARYVAADAGATCATGTVCKNGSCIDRGPDEKALCMANAPEGAPCDTALGPACTAPARCVRGACKLPDPARCL